MKQHIVWLLILSSVLFVTGIESEENNLEECSEEHTCEANEIYSECGNNACQNTCKNPSKSITCKAGCVSGCICKEKYLRNSKGVCVLAEKCDTCKKNEVFSLCGNHSCYNTCSQPDNTRLCKPGGCRPGCICKGDMIRDDAGNCVRPKDCPNRCPTDPRAIVVPCGDPCPTTCDNKDDGGIRRCPKVCIRNGCKCLAGYVKGKDGKCILPETCPKKPPPTKPSCPKNEVYSECGNHGCQDTCKSPNKSKVSKCACIPGCVCSDGYLRNTKGVCVKVVECDTCNANEVLDLCRNTECQNTCAEPDLEARCTSPTGCNAGCVCKDGFVRDENKRCIPKDECSCGGDPNAFFDPCGNVCPITCNNRDNPPMCDAVCATEGACRCKRGYLANYLGKCIKEADCPICGPNEFFDCGSACDTTCATLGEPCGIINKRCNEKCYCREGFARNSEGVCITIDQCPPRVCPTDPNATIVPCGDPCPMTCENKDEKGRPCPEICIINGCKCNDGYVLGADGKCSLAKNCPLPKLKCKKTEMYVACPSPCPGETNCARYLDGNYPLCPVQLNPKNCKPACRCKNGLVRNNKGECVAPEKCCTEPNTKLVASPNVCPGGTCSHPEFSECEIIPPAFACQCVEGYLKMSDDSPTCIPKDQCCDYART